jgi:hypothetical protein
MALELVGTQTARIMPPYSLLLVQVPTKEPLLYWSLFELQWNCRLSGKYNVGWMTLRRAGRRGENALGGLLGRSPFFARGRAHRTEKARCAMAMGRGNPERRAPCDPKRWAARRGEVSNTPTRRPSAAYAKEELRAARPRSHCERLTIDSMLIERETTGTAKRRRPHPIPATSGGLLDQDRGGTDSSTGHNGTHVCWWSDGDDDDYDVCEGDDRPWNCSDAFAAPAQPSKFSLEVSPTAAKGGPRHQLVEPCAVVSIESPTHRLRRKRKTWTAHHDRHEHLVSALAALQLNECGALELVGWAIPRLEGTIGVGFLPTASSSSLSSSLLELHLVQCAMPDLSVLNELTQLEELRITDCHVRDVSAREWKTFLSTLTCLTTLRLEALELDNAALHSIASNIGHVTNRISIGPLYNLRQFFPSLRTIVQESRCRTLELYGGGPKDSNLIHVVNGLGRLKRQQRGISTGDASDNAVRTLVVENFACSQALFAKLCRRLHHHSSLENGWLRHFSFASARDGPSASSPHPPTVDLLPVMALLQSNTRLESLCLDPPIQVDTQWHAPLLRAVQRSTHLEELDGFVLVEPDDEKRGANEARWREQIDFCLELNRCGRRALDLPSVRSNWALWPHVLHHALDRSNDPNVVLYFLKACLHWQ